MSFPPGPFAVDSPPSGRWTELYDELAELCGQRNAIDGRIVDLVAEMDHSLIGNTGCRSVAAWVGLAHGMLAGQRGHHRHGRAARRGVPQCTEALREGRLSVDQVGVIADRGGDGSDGHYVEVAAVSTVAPLRTAVKLEPKPDPIRPPSPNPDAASARPPVVRVGSTPPGRSPCRNWTRRGCRLRWIRTGRR